MEFQGRAASWVCKVTSVPTAPTSQGAKCGQHWIFLQVNTLTPNLPERERLASRSRESGCSEAGGVQWPGGSSQHGLSERKQMSSGSEARALSGAEMPSTEQLWS